MQLNPKTLRLLLSLNDDQLAGVIRSLAAESGIDTAGLVLDPASLSGIRNALRSVSDDDLSALFRLYEDFKNEKK